MLWKGIVSAPDLILLFFLRIRRPPRSTLFPSTTLFRSDDARVGHARVFGGGRESGVEAGLLVGLDGNPEGLPGEGGGEPGGRLEATGGFVAAFKAIAVGAFERDRIPPPDAGVHASVREEVPAVHLQLLDDVLGVAEHEGVVGVKFVDEAVEDYEVGEGGVTAGDALFGVPAKQAGMMAERQDAVAHLLRSEEHTSE